MTIDNHPLTPKPVDDRGMAFGDHQVLPVDRLSWHMPDNLRWLADQDHRPNYLPCGMLTGQFLKLCAEKWEGEIAARKALDTRP